MRHKCRTRTSPRPDVNFPQVLTDDWESSGHLLTLGELIGGIRGKILRKVSAQEASRQVSKIAVRHWISRNISPVSWQMVHQRLTKDYTEFMNVRKLIMKGSFTKSTNERYNTLKLMKDKVYNICSLKSNQPAAKKKN